MCARLLASKMQDGSVQLQAAHLLGLENCILHRSQKFLVPMVATVQRLALCILHRAAGWGLTPHLSGVVVQASLSAERWDKALKVKEC